MFPCSAARQLLFRPCNGLCLNRTIRAVFETFGEEQKMKNLFKTLNGLQIDESGQGLAEYVLIMAVVAFGAVTGMGSLASGVNSAFTQVSTIFGKYIN